MPGKAAAAEHADQAGYGDQPVDRSADQPGDRPIVAVVLGGGAARGFSHIGLLKALEEEGIPVDILVGASMGSVVAGLYASGIPADQLEWMVQEIELAEFFSPIIPPRGGLLSTARFERFLDELTGGVNIEELPTPFYTIITDVVTGESVVLSSGRLSEAIVASMSIPGMFPPKYLGGVAYVDGGIKEPLPVLVAREAGADVVIAVDVRRQMEEIDLDVLLTNVQLTIYSLAYRNIDTQLAAADVIISPDVHTSSYMEYYDAARFIAEGYRAAKEAAPRIKALLREKDPEFVFEPRTEGGTAGREADPNRAAAGAASDAAGDHFRRRFEQALAASRPNILQPGLYGGTALAAEAGRNLRLDLDVGARLWASQGAALFGEYDLSLRLTEGITHTLGVGLKVSGFAGKVFLRKTPGDARPAPGAGVKLRVGGEAGARLSLDGEWVRREGAPDERRLDVAAGWAFPLKRNEVFWELALLEPSLYVAAGVESLFAGGVQASRPRIEGGYDFSVRLFGIYPMRGRIALAFRPGESPWAFSLSFGE